MCAATRLSFVSTDCVPVKSILKTVAVNVMEVMASLIRKVAVPNEAGRGAPPTSVGLVGGFSPALVRFAVSKMLACAVPQNKAKDARQKWARVINFLLPAIMSTMRGGVNAR